LFASNPNFQGAFWDISPTLKDNKLVIRHIWSKELEKILDLGGQIIKIDNIDTETRGVYEVLLNSPMTKSQKVTLIFKTKKGEIIVKQPVSSPN